MARAHLTVRVYPETLEVIALLKKENKYMSNGGAVEFLAEHYLKSTVTPVSVEQPKPEPCTELVQVSVNTSATLCSGEILGLFDHWVQVMNKKAGTKLTKGRKTVISARLKEGYPVSDIRQAIDNCSRSPFHMGQNDNGTLYNDITLICRNGEKLESFRDMGIGLPGGPVNAASKKEQANLSVAEEWIRSRNEQER